MIYEYLCKPCNLVFEEQRPLELRNEVQYCPKCKERTGIRKISIPMFDTGGTNMEKLGRLDDNNKYKKGYH